MQIRQTTNETCGKILKSLEDSTKISTQLKDAKRSEEKRRNNAVWIGVIRHNIWHMLLIPYKKILKSKEQVEEWLGKGMVEREEYVKTGIEYGALKKDEYICIDRLMNHIYALTKESANDKDKK